MPASPARVAAFEVLLQVQTQKAYASELLHSSRLDELSTQDRALCMQLVMGVLRWQSRLDLVLSDIGVEKQQLSRFDPEVLIALRLAIFQFQFLERIPDSAAVNDSVELVKRARKRSAAGLVNALLRKAARHPKSHSQVAPHSPDALAAQYAHPRWLVERWVSRFGLATAVQICKLDQIVPPISLRLHPAHNNSQMDLELRKDGVEVESGALMATARRVVKGDVTKTGAFRDGRVAIQDEAAQLVAALVGEGEWILDCCAAPGGKASAMAQANSGAQVIATELHVQRARLMKSLIRESNIQVLTADARQLPLSSSFDRVLADVPCSGTGTLSRNPEIKWQLDPPDLDDLHVRQIAILASALDRVAHNGRLVYSTCSLENIENEMVVEECLASRPEFHLRDCRDALNELKQSGKLIWQEMDSLRQGPFLQTLPGVHPCDGFFAAIIERNG